MAQPAPSSPRGGSPRLAGLISRALAQDSGADEIHALSEQLHREFAPGLARHIARLAGSPPESDHVQELTQRTWIAFWDAVRNRRYDPARAAPSTFMYAVAHIIVLRERRDAARETRRAQARIEQADRSSLSGEVSEALILVDQIERVREALAGREGDLSPDERTALRIIGQGGTDRELARLLGISPSTAHHRKKHALARLADWLSSARADAPSAPALDREEHKDGQLLSEPTP